MKEKIMNTNEPFVMLDMESPIILGRDPARDAATAYASPRVLASVIQVITAQGNAAILIVDPDDHPKMRDGSDLVPPLTIIALAADAKARWSEDMPPDEASENIFYVVVLVDTRSRIASALASRLPAEKLVQIADAPEGQVPIILAHTRWKQPIHVAHFVPRGDPEPRPGNAA